MTHLKLFHFPAACSRVTMTALETIGCAYDDQMVNLMAGEHLLPEYRAHNPRGKVPALLVDGTLLTENAAILLWLDATYPGAKLFPKPKDAFDQARVHTDLFWLSSVWHPSARAMKMPMRWTVGDVDPVRAKGRELMTPLVDALEARLAGALWCYGDVWAITDVYFYWAYTTAEEGSLDLTRYPEINRHRLQVEALPAFQAALERENAAKIRHAEFLNERPK
jgi:glutathione S-transferase